MGGFVTVCHDNLSQIYKIYNHVTDSHSYKHIFLGAVCVGAVF